MKILAFDTCFDGCSVCVAEQRGAAVVALSSRMERFETGHAERLIPMIGEAMDETRVAFGDLDRIAVTVGPGTFTGTRIGIAAARSLDQRGIAPPCPRVCRHGEGSLRPTMAHIGQKPKKPLRSAIAPVPAIR